MSGYPLGHVLAHTGIARVQQHIETLDRKLGGLQIRSGHRGGKPLVIAGNQRRLLGRQVCSLVAIPTELSRLLT
jgi:hypothetical protein